MSRDGTVQNEVAQRAQQSIRRGLYEAFIPTLDACLATGQTNLISGIDECNIRSISDGNQVRCAIPSASFTFNRNTKQLQVINILGEEFDNIHKDNWQGHIGTFLASVVGALSSAKVPVSTYKKTRDQFNEISEELTLGRVPAMPASTPQDFDAAQLGPHTDKFR